MRSPITLFSDDQAGAFANAELQGDIGQQILGRFKIFLDYEHLRIILEPARNYGKPFTQASAGVVVVGEGPQYKVFRVADVLENSPASEAGLQKDDFITAVDGRSAEQLSVSTLMDMFEKPVTYRLELKRRENILHVTLRPREMI
ncbi:MAG TPA: PDZ domain-containing protein [Terriglobales bacterium]|nr:PDZ domain-containing protein [Terriglobales bacterium]